MDNPRVLIVDDAPENIHILMATLKDEYTIMAANNGKKAFEMSKAEPRPDIILLDIMMPGMDGYETCKMLKADDRTSGIPVVFLTSRGDDHDEKKGLDCGALDYIAKPFSPDLVRARLRNHPELKRYRNHLEELVEERTRELIATQDAMIAGLATLVEYRDPETSGHIKRTQNYIRVLAESLRDHPAFRHILIDENIHIICNSAPLHDIGKVAIPDSILLKAGSLTKEEFMLMKKHTVYGREAIMRMEMEMGDQDSSFLRFAAEIAYTHHERWDGSGYHGIKGKHIPIPGRLMALADVYDALISKRVYKEPLSHRMAMEIMSTGTERTQPHHFDPDVLDAFVEKQKEFFEIAIEYADSDEERKTLQS